MKQTVTAMILAFASATYGGSVTDLVTESGFKGGLVVHIGCSDGSETLKLQNSSAWLVRGLDRNPENVQIARRRISDAGQYGPVSFDVWNGRSLSFISNMVNILIVEDSDSVGEEECMRVLCPRGKLYLNKGGKWETHQKPLPGNTDEWTHSLYDAGGNAVSRDMVAGPPKGLQWTASPKWTRHHEAASSFQAMVSANGRVFYLIDEGPQVSLFLPSSWQLVARDAYNGKLLWKRPFKRWVTQLFNYKSGPTQMSHRIVAVDERVFVAANLDEGVTVVDAATGKALRYLENTAATEEILFCDGLLYLVTTDKPFLYQSGDRFSRGNAWSGQTKSVRAVNPETSEGLWKFETPVAPLSFAVNDYGVFLHDGANILKLDRKTGKTIWKSDPVPLDNVIPTSNTPTLALYKDVVLFLGGKDGKHRGGGWYAMRNLRTLTSLSAETGKILWTTKYPPSGFECPKDVLVLDGLVWMGAILLGQNPGGVTIGDEKRTANTGIFSGLNIHTGKVEREFKPPWEKLYWFHQRCHRSRATERYIMPGRTGIEFISPETGWESFNHWVRGACLYGTMPANGLVYQPQHPCGCYMESMLHGFNALSPVANGGATQSDEPFQKGPAYDLRSGPDKSDRDGEWPVFRRDAARSCSTKVTVLAELKTAWTAKVGENLSAITVAGGLVCVADKDAHTVYALDSKTGKAKWKYTVGARVDSPPAIAGGRILFGSRDGYLYCLNASDGKLAWRYRVAPEEKYLMADDQLESVWPLNGSPLVIEDKVYTVAGRSMFLDEGLRFVCLDIITGNLIHDRILDETDPLTSGKLQDKIIDRSMPPANPDILSYNGRNVFMNMQKFNLDGSRPEIKTVRNAKDQSGADAHLFVNGGFLDDTGFHRIQMLYGKTFTGGSSPNHMAPKYAPGGKMLAFNDKHVFGFSRLPHLHRWVRELQWHIYRTPKPGVARSTDDKPESKPVFVEPAKGKGKGRRRRASKGSINYEWSSNNPDLYVNSMVLAGDKLFIAGPPAVRNDNSPEALAKWQGSSGGLLWVLSTEDGRKLFEVKLVSPPVYEGMAAAYGKLFVALRDGSMVCLE